ncbi:MAG TPA: GNAT family N-acetyltransferase, partial [Roseiflexaceae bacterium]|nr:GNAT family N-acetyltransferase [Roseiflexaceae bacterium]
FDVVTESPLRARGYGRRLMHGIMAWAARRGASHTYLQVVETNLPARRLYASLGFSEAYPYWYRVRI